LIPLSPSSVAPQAIVTGGGEQSRSIGSDPRHEVAAPAGTVEFAETAGDGQPR